MLGAVKPVSFRRSMERLALDLDSSFTYRQRFLTACHGYVHFFRVVHFEIFLDTFGALAAFICCWRRRPRQIRGGAATLSGHPYFSEPVVLS